MRKGISLLVCAVMLLSLSACGMDWTYCRGMNYLSKGDYAAAYETLQAATHPNAAKELEKFIYVPATHTYMSPSRNQTTTYTYNEMGYPIKIETVLDGDTHVDTYVYEDTVLREHRITSTYADGDTYNSVYTYTEWGKEQDFAYYHNDSKIGERRTVYDEDRRVLRFEEKGDGYHNWEENIYDDKGRKLTSKGSHQGIDFSATYTYAEDGTYVENREDDYGEEKWRTQIHYDKADRIVRSHSVLVGSAGTDATRLDEYTYDKAGNEIYHYSKWGTTVETTTAEYDKDDNLVYKKTLNEAGETKDLVRYTYNEEGDILTREYSPDGLAWRKDTYTYDDQGNLLNEYHTDSATGEVREVKYTYNEDGTLKMSEETGRNGSIHNAYGYDELGNRVQSLSQQGLSETTATATWQWFYYPHGVPEILANAMEEMEWD